MNNFKRRITFTTLLILVLVLIPAGLVAQSPISASVDRTSATTDDLVTLSVAVNSQGSAAQPQLPALEGFQVVGTSTSTQINMVNGAMSASVGYDYRLQPTRTGDLTIPSIAVTIDGQTYQTAPISIQVSQGTGIPSTQSGAPLQSLLPPGLLGESDHFLEASVDNATPYVGEQIAYTVRYFEAVDALLMPSFFGGQPAYTAPSFTGFWSEGETEQRSYRTTTGGRTYEVAELRTVLFPTASGAVTLEPAQVTLPNSVFQRGGVVQSDPVTVNVQALPAGAPIDFTGAVGTYAVRAEADLTATDTDNPVTVQLTVIGQGNVSTAGDPTLPDMAGWRVFPGQAEVTTKVQDGLVYGQRVYKHVLAPVTTGVLTIPSIAYSYFDPTAGVYHTVTTEPLTVDVTQGTTPLMPATTDSGAPTTAEEVATTLALKPLGPTLSKLPQPLTSQSWYWLLWLMPLAALSGGFVWQRRQAYHLHNAATIRSSRAGRSARKALARAHKLGDATAKLDAVQLILVEYLTAKLRQPVAGLTQQEIGRQLAACGVEDDLIQRTLETWHEVESSRFAPANAAQASADALLDTMETLVAALDGVL